MRIPTRVNASTAPATTSGHAQNGSPAAFEGECLWRHVVWRCSDRHCCVAPQNATPIVAQQRATLSFPVGADASPHRRLARGGIERFSEFPALTLVFSDLCPTNFTSGSGAACSVLARPHAPHLETRLPDGEGITAGAASQHQARLDPDTWVCVQSLL